MLVKTCFYFALSHKRPSILFERGFDPGVGVPYRFFRLLCLLDEIGKGKTKFDSGHVGKRVGDLNEGLLSDIPLWQGNAKQVSDVCLFYISIPTDKHTQT